MRRPRSLRLSTPCLLVQRRHYRLHHGSPEKRTLDFRRHPFSSPARAYSIFALVEGNPNAELTAEPIKATPGGPFDAAARNLQHDPAPRQSRRHQDQGLAITRGALGNHTWRATGITAYMKNGGLLEHAQQLANHSSPRTTKLYDRRQDEISLDEVERIAI